MKMDLNLPLLPRRRSPRCSNNPAAHEFDLALRPLPPPSEEIPAPPSTSGAAAAPSDSHAPYSPSHPSYNTDLPSIATTRQPFVEMPSREYEPFTLPHSRISPPGSPYSPSDLHGFPFFDQRFQELNFQFLEQVETAAAGGESATPYLSPYAPRSPSPPPFLDEADSFSHQEILEFPEFSLRRRLRRGFRSSLPYDIERSNIGRPTSPVSEPQLQIADHNVPAKQIATEGSDEDEEEKKKNSANFECNICLDLAKEPVVTSCGHLFCWPCLHQWLNLHLASADCPVCKGGISESNITPIYGRGSSGSGKDKKLGENEESGLKIPSRPHGNRFESFRQRFQHFSGTLPAPEFGQLPLDQQMQSRSIIELQNFLRFDNGGDHTPLTSLTARRMPMVDRIAERRPSSGEIGLPSFSMSIPDRSNSSLHGLASSDRSAAITAEPVRVVGRRSNRYAASTSSANPPSPEQLRIRHLAPVVTDSPPGPSSAASTSSANPPSPEQLRSRYLAPVVTDSSPGPSNAGSTGLRRSVGRIGISSSLDVDGGDLHTRKRRLN